MALNPSAAPKGDNEYENPYYDAQAITVNTPFTACRAIYNGNAANNLTITLLSGNSVAFKAVPIGILAVSATNITAAGTATDLVALY